MWDSETSKCHVWLPFPPDIAGQIGARFEGRLTWCPAGRCDFTSGADMLKRLDLTDQFGDATADFRGQYFHGSDDEIRVNDESAADICL